MDEDLLDEVVEISEGNPGAATVLARVFNVHGEEVFRCVLADLKEKGISGSFIWVDYKDAHGQILSAFVGSHIKITSEEE